MRAKECGKSPPTDKGSAYDAYILKDAINQILRSEKCSFKNHSLTFPYDGAIRKLHAPHGKVQKKRLKDIFDEKIHPNDSSRVSVTQVEETYKTIENSKSKKSFKDSILR